MYIYQTTIFTELSNVMGVNEPQNLLDKTDFETNYKNNCYVVSDITFAETTIVVNKTYSQLKSLIISPTLWNDVKLVIDKNHYDIYLFSENPL